MIYRRHQADKPEARKKRLLRLYALAIRAAEEHRCDDLVHCLDILRAGLNPIAGLDLALSLHELYGDIERAARSGQYAEAAHSLESLKGLWDARARLDHALIAPHRGE
ncbi:hypothetical protein H5P28_12300 [Ruficoccus amylovorans]|uniref:Flagellar protein FliS n=1 Tax=Ruficoccus amylovorans TaxID=1804625 RepID=A0A842HFQ4_9BACT|nr:hypothetical protein [Ruficoccus amylovorans]MBC2595040.1 hypothetical protein [Ruficoccus amylovorans]